MAEDEPYDLLPHQELEELKRQVQELKSRFDKSSSQEVAKALYQLTRSMDAMLRLFTEASHEIKGDDKEHEKIADKLDEIIDQNGAIAEGVVAVSDMIADSSNKREIKVMPAPKPIPSPMFQQGGQESSQNMPRFEPEFNEQEFNQPVQSPPRFNQPMPQGPVPMPSFPFSDFELEEKPKKKGIFGRLKK